MNAIQRRQQVGRVHAAKGQLGLGDDEYRQLVESLTGQRSCTGMSDRQLNHVLDWLNWMTGRRHRQPLAFDGHACADVHANMVRLCYATANILPAGYERSPMRSMTWQVRTCGRCSAFFEDLGIEDLTKLIEGLKAILARQAAAAERQTFAAEHPQGVLWGSEANDVAPF